MGEHVRHDITSASYEEFVGFLFDHDVVPIPTQDNQPEPWYWRVDVLFDPRQVAGFYIRLFLDPSFLVTAYSAAQLEQGFWAIQSENLDCSVSLVLWHQDIPVEIRETCVRTMFHLFENLFSKVTSATACNMWWDSLAYDWHCGNRKRANGGEDEFMQDVMFETLSRILFLPSLQCQLAALHGLGHLHHPHAPFLIERYIDANEPMDARLREYAQAAARFEVM